MHAPTPANTLPEPDAADEARSRALIASLRRQAAAAGGALGFDRYMERALYEPGLGYYASVSRKFGAEGDFITAPELGPLFSACVATQLERWFAAGVHPEVWEFGAGSGALMAGLASALDRRGVEARFHIVELSGALKARQRERLAQACPQALARTHWHDTLPQTLKGVVLANELLDALPVRLFEVGGASGPGITERVVRPDPDGPGLMMASKPADARFAEEVEARLLSAGWPAARSPVCYRSELGEQAPAWVASVGERLQSGALLLIDYGFPSAEYYHPQRNQGTLNCHYRHRSHADPLWRPGLSDVTAHVDFSAIYAAARSVGLDCLGYSSQANFLLGADFPQHFEACSDQADPVTQARLAREATMLVSEAEMGELFKVIAFGRGEEMGRLSLAGRDRQRVLAD